MNELGFVGGAEVGYRAKASSVMDLKSTRNVSE